MGSAPLLRDTVFVPSNGQVVLRVVANNPGMLMLRSMNANAHLRGAATVLNVLPSQQIAVPSQIQPVDLVQLHLHLSSRLQLLWIGCLIRAAHDFPFLFLFASGTLVI